jgi:acyl-CoA synthetase (NDP forming)
VPIVVIWGSPDATQPAYRRLLEQHRMPVFRSFQSCIRGLSAYFAYHRLRAGYRSAFDDRSAQPDPAATAAAAMLDGVHGVVDDAASLAVLDSAGIRVARSRLAADDEAVARAAAELAGSAGTVVLKTASAQIPHRSEHGLVMVGVSPADAVASAQQLRERAAAAVPGARLDGILVCEQVTGGVEVIVGCSHAAPFGATVMVGLGGVLTELLADVRFLVSPFTRDDAERAVRRLRGFPLLDGFRGRAAADLDALLDLLMALQRLVVAAGDRISELDLNPVTVLPAGQGAVALDALLVAG